MLKLLLPVLMPLRTFYSWRGKELNIFGNDSFRIFFVEIICWDSTIGASQHID